MAAGLKASGPRVVSRAVSPLEHCERLELEPAAPVQTVGPAPLEEHLNGATVAGRPATASRPAIARLEAGGGRRAWPASRRSPRPPGARC
jgi:hypothetical protein